MNWLTDKGKWIMFLLQKNFSFLERTKLNSFFLKNKHGRRTDSPYQLISFIFIYHVRMSVFCQRNVAVLLTSTNNQPNWFSDWENGPLIFQCYWLKFFFFKWPISWFDHPYHCWFFTFCKIVMLVAYLWGLCTGFYCNQL